MNQFDKRLEELNNSSKTPESEVNASIKAYERLVTAKKICSDIFGPKHVDRPEIVISVFEAICREATIKDDG